MRGGIFLDRDGTIIEDPGYISRPDQVALLPQAAEGLSRLAAEGWPLVIVSNQSGIARGHHTAEDFSAVNQRMMELLSPRGVTFRGAYYCPHHPDVTGPCACRKPGTELFERAARDWGLDVSACWFVGDRVRDAEPAKRLGGRALLVGRQDPADRARESGLGIERVPDLLAAAERIGRPGA